MDPGGDDLDQVLARMASDKITSSTAGEAALMKAMDGSTVKDSYNWNTDAGYKKLHAFAKKTQDAEIRQRNSKTGQEASSTAMGEQAARNDYFGRIDQVLQRGTTAKLSDDELVQNFLSGLGAEAPAPAAVVPPQVAPQAAPVVAPPQQAAPAGIMPPAQVVPPVAAPAPVQAGIMPPATESIPQVLGQLAKTGIEANDTGIRTLKYLSDQTGLGVIELVKSLKNAPEWIAKFGEDFGQGFNQ